LLINMLNRGMIVIEHVVEVGPAQIHLQSSRNLPIPGVVCVRNQHFKS